MSEVFFTADLHLGHRLVSELRGFSSPDRHDEAVLQGIADTVPEGDSLWILGDISSGGSVGQREALSSLSLLSDELNIDLHLVAGNHDGAHPMHRNFFKWDAKYRKVFKSVQPFARRRINGTSVWLSHFPWRGGGDHTEVDRYETVRLNDPGSDWLLHGHTHSSEQIERGLRMIHVGVDACDMRPVAISTITRLMEDANHPPG